MQAQRWIFHPSKVLCKKKNILHLFGLEIGCSLFTDFYTLLNEVEVEMVGRGWVVMSVLGCAIIVIFVFIFAIRVFYMYLFYSMNQTSTKNAFNN